jgi:acetyl-CoA carboxylase biotin carboxylase subunit
MKIKKVVIANRGEIAVRIMRACRELGIGTVAVYSEADGAAYHVRYADQAYPIGPAPSNESYLCGDKIIDAAKKSGAQAIHPGYGFLAENPQFAENVQESGLIFIGPNPETIGLLGDKMTARKTMLSAGVPVVPGYQKAIKKLEQAQSIAGDIGFPVLIKAAAGGGGKGMRVVQDAPRLEESLRAAGSEAKSAFGDGRVYIEKYLERPRHIEIQIIADKFGNTVHLGERECSIQRRHQKVVEESPSPVIDAAMRTMMGEAAIAAARASGYLNAGTVEFLVDADMNFYFLEVNTRLQVEHPVTEMVTGLDLVKEQISIAAGKKLSFSQKNITWKGAAIECRIYAEDAENNFLPSVGTITTYREPGGPGIRVDSGLNEGDVVQLYYDPLISKLVAWGATRKEAIARMQRALEEYTISGVKTGIPFHQSLLRHKKFTRGEISTHFIEEEFLSESSFSIDAALHQKKAMAVASCLIDFSRKVKSHSGTPTQQFAEKKWKAAGRRTNVAKGE